MPKLKLGMLALSLASPLVGGAPIPAKTADDHGRKTSVAQTEDDGLYRLDMPAAYCEQLVGLTDDDLGGKAVCAKVTTPRTVVEGGSAAKVVECRPLDGPNCALDFFPARGFKGTVILPPCNCDNYQVEGYSSISEFEDFLLESPQLCAKDHDKKRNCYLPHPDYPAIGVEDGGALTYRGCRSDMIACTSTPFAWVQRGQVLHGDHGSAYFGTRVSLSGDGQTLAASAGANNGPDVGKVGRDDCTDCGLVRVYSWDGASGRWHLKGQELHGINKYDWFGQGLAISYDGKIVAVGASGKDGWEHWEEEEGGMKYVGAHPEDFGKGAVYVYEWVPDELAQNLGLWRQQGMVIHAERSRRAWFGSSVSLSSDGTILAAGAYGNGKEYMTLKQWRRTHPGADDLVEHEETFTDIVDGEEVVLAPGAIAQNKGGYRAGHVQVFRRDPSTPLGWAPMGQDIDGEFSLDESGGGDDSRNVALSADGHTVAIGARKNDGIGYGNVNRYYNNDNRGHTRVHTFDGSRWVQLGQDIDGEAESDYSGAAVAISANGRTVAIGAPYNDGDTDKSSTSQGSLKEYYTDDSRARRELQHHVAKRDGLRSSSGHIRVFDYVPAPDGHVVVPDEARLLKEDAICRPANGPHLGTFDTLQACLEEAGKRHFRYFTWYDEKKFAFKKENARHFAGLCYGEYTENACNGDTHEHFEEYKGRGNGFYERIEDPLKGKWVQRGYDINGKFIGETFGWSLALSADGNTVLGGGAMANSPYGYSNYDPSRDVGVLRVYSWEAEEWRQRGKDIWGVGYGSHLGYSASMSADGGIIVGSASDNTHRDAIHYGSKGTGGNYDQGTVHVYSPGYATPSVGPAKWKQLGQVVVGEEMDNMASSVALSKDGNVMAIGNYWNSGTAPDMTGHAKPGEQSTGHVRAFRYDAHSGQWLQMGSEINGEHPGDSFGTTISLSADGMVLAAGGPHNSDRAEKNGHVRVYAFDDGEWVKVGDDIEKNAIFEDEEGEDLPFSHGPDEFGDAVRLSDSGTRLVVGAPNAGQNYPGPDDKEGRVYVFEWDSSASKWKTRDEIPGTKRAYGKVRTGESVSCNHDCNIVAIGSPGYGKIQGAVRVLRWSEGASKYVQMGPRIIGEDVSLDGRPDGYVGIGGSSSYSDTDHAVDLSADGHTLAFMSKRGPYLFTYKWNEKTQRWNDMGTIVVPMLDEGPPSAKDTSSMALSDDGLRAVTGHHYAKGLIGAYSHEEGKVCIHEFSDGSWKTVSTLRGQQGYSGEFGVRVAISGDGYTVLSSSDGGGFTGVIETDHQREGYGDYRGGVWAYRTED